MTTFLAGSEVGGGLTTGGRPPQKQVSPSVPNKRDTHVGSAIDGSILQITHDRFSNAHTLEVLDNTVAINAADIPASGDAVSNIGINAKSCTKLSDLQEHAFPASVPGRSENGVAGGSVGVFNGAAASDASVDNASVNDAAASDTQISADGTINIDSGVANIAVSEGLSLDQGGLSIDLMRSESSERVDPKKGSSWASIADASPDEDDTEG